MHKFNFDGLEETVEKLKGKNVYLTVDLDVLDPSIFPGTGTPEAGGVSFDELRRALTLVCSKLNVVACDVNELSPVYDQSGVSTAVAYKIIREMLLAMSQKENFYGWYRNKKAEIGDAEQILNIYSYYVKNTAVTFEYEVPHIEEFRNRMKKTLLTYPYIAAKYEGRIVGYAYAGSFIGRKAYDCQQRRRFMLKRIFADAESDKNYIKLSKKYWLIWELQISMPASVFLKLTMSI